MDLNQVTLETRNFNESLEFYKKLGLRLIVLSEGRYARFEMPSGSSTLSLHQAEEPAIGNTVLYFEVDDVERKFEELSASGIVFETPPTDEHWRWKEARFTDPAGNKLCLFHAGPDRRFPPWRLGE
ncbi:VOC family protein [Rhodobacteraceae bacterium RKSG542]|uniref:VOC family protein n=1 Tax=Pseudovibrio flavus TaxID=2529854 RepID=UPI0012BBBAA1|nr:VOC family protein [Pseudovibrio flavus]MTI17011.1 VOC family protein [Pseudovibrio flavus]